MEQRVNNIIRSVQEEREVEYNNVPINENMHLRDDLGLDSLGLALLTVHIEDEFGVDIFEEGVISKVGEVYRKVNNHIQ